MSLSILNLSEEEVDMPIDMKLNVSDNTAANQEPEFQKPEYPHGLRIYLEKEQLSRLNMSEDPEVGKELELVAKVKVVAVSQDELKGGGEHKNVTLQITDMNLFNKKADADTFYGD